MAKQLIVVVHGVGVKEAGISADLLATALDDTPEDTFSRNGAQNASPRPHSSDDFHQRELKIYNEGGKRQVFPARIRRYRKYEQPNQPAIHERVIADFYWGDIAAIGSGSWSLIRGFLTTVLGLSHIVRESAREVFKGSDWWNRSMRWLANVAVLSIHGPIAAINIVLLFGLAVSLGMQRAGFDAGSYASAVVAGFFAVGASAWFVRRSQAYLARHLWLWTGLTGLFLCQFGLLGAFGLGDQLKELDHHFRSAACFWPGADNIQSDACMNSYGGLHLIGLRLLRLMEVAWLVVLGCAVGLWLGEYRYGKIKDRVPRTSLVVQALTLMILLWILMMGSIWAIVGQIPGFVAHKYQVQAELGMLVLVLMMLAILAVVAIFLVVRVKRFVAGLKSPADYLDEATANAKRNRLIVSSLVLLVMDIFLMILIISAIHLALGSLLPDFIRKPLDAFQKFKTSNVGPALLIASAVATLLVTTFAAQFRAGLGIATDVITYLNNYSWTEAGRDKAESVRSETERPQYEGYWPRERIRDRLKVLVDQLIADENPDELAIVSHSQGTVVALDVLDEHGRGWLQRLKPGGQIALVTMGSPYTHIHHHYFPDSFPAVSKRANFAQSPNGVISRWFNIFRVDDFVGTHIDPDGLWPKEYPVAANGHTYYWVDENVFTLLKKFLDFEHTREIEELRHAPAATLANAPQKKSSRAKTKPAAPIKKPRR